MDHGIYLLREERYQVMWSCDWFARMLSVCERTLWEMAGLSYCPLQCELYKSFLGMSLIRRAIEGLSLI